MVTQVTLTRTFTQLDYDRFARLTGDDNPIHVDPEFAARTRFGRTLAHGMMLFSTLSGMVRRHLGAQTIREVELTFPGPTYVGDVLDVKLELSSDEAAVGEAVVDAQITGPDGAPTCVARMRVTR